MVEPILDKNKEVLRPKYFMHMFHFGKEHLDE